MQFDTWFETEANPMVDLKSEFWSGLSVGFKKIKLV